jgi:hypothetical protein
MVRLWHRSENGNMRPDDLLARMAATLRGEIGPGVVEPFAKTQAFMAAVILERLGRQLGLAESQAQAELDDLAALAGDLGRSLGVAPSPRVGEALQAVASGDGRAVGALIEALYAERAELGRESFEAALGRVRVALRSRLDRQLEYAS